MTLQRTRTYECMCLLDNREVRKGWQPLKDAVTGLFTKHGAKILSSRRWDERRLAYAMNGQHRGTYLLIYAAIDTKNVAAIRRDMQFNDALLRSLLLEVAEVPQEAYEPEAAFDVNAIPADDAPAYEPPPPPPPPAPAAAGAEAEPSTEAPTGGRS
jgi:small subunit ribosomal protein S6